MRFSAHRFQTAYPLILLLALLAARADQVAAQEAGSASAAIADSLNDGPHIYWQDPSTAIAFYLCDEEVVERRYEVRDTLRFSGLCDDSTQEYVIAAGGPAVDPHIYEDVSKIIAISDVHGEYEALVAFLKAAAIVDDEFDWIWGDGHLVIDGDTFDRGDKVTECMWLFYRLEQQARRAGGRVHFLLGNHETMVIQSDLRYVHDKYMKGVARRARVDYADLYGPDMEMGRWLRTKHTAVKLNGVLFVHGGIPPRLVEGGVSLTAMNELARETLDLRSYEVAFNEKIRKFYGHSDEGPFWYRGYHHDEEGRYAQATQEQVEATLEAYGARAVVVGHSGVDQVMGLYDGKVFALDIPLRELGSFQGLLIEDGRFYRVTGDGSREPL